MEIDVDGFEAVGLRGKVAVTRREDRFSPPGAARSGGLVQPDLVEDAGRLGSGAAADPSEMDVGDLIRAA